MEGGMYAQEFSGIIKYQETKIYVASPQDRRMKETVWAWSFAKDLY